MWGEGFVPGTGGAIVAALARIARIDPDGIRADTLIAEELGIDSLLTIEIVANVESHFGIELDESLLVGVSTVGDFVTIVQSQINGQEGRVEGATTD